MTRQGNLFKSGALALALGAAALMLGSGGATAADPPIKIGIESPHTGPAARVGTDVQNGTLLALEDARKAGELPVKVDGKSRDIATTLVDDESSPEKAVKAVRKAVTEDKIDLLFMGWHSSVGLAIIDVSAEYNLLHFGSLPATKGINDKINEKGYKHYFKGWPVIGAMAELYVDALNHWEKKGAWAPKAKKAGIVIEDSDWGRGWGDAIKTRLKGSGWEIVGEDVTKMDETAFGPIMTKYKALGATLVGFTYNNPASVFAAVKAHYDAGVGGMLFADGMGWFPEWHQGVGEAATTAVSMDSPRPITPEQKDWMKRYKERFGHDASPASAGHAYDYMRMLIKGLAKAGTIESKKLGETLLNFEYTGIWHGYTFAKKAGDRALSPYEVQTGPFMKGFSFPMVQYYKDKSYVVWPDQFAEDKFRAPE